MDSYPKYTNIHINPSFNDTMKSVIHINPKIHGNMAIHVNPKIVNTLHSTELQQHLLQRKNKEQVTGTYDTNKNNIQKSVYVNPKLMLKLQNKVTQQIDQIQKQTSIQPQINPVINKPLETQKNTNNLCKNSLSSKYISPNFVALSKNKLVRVTSDAKKNINYQEKTTLHTVKKINTTKKLINVNTAKKLVNVNTAKKLINVNTSKKLVNTTKKLVNINSKNLSKPKELNSKNTKYKIDRTVIQKSKNKTDLSARKLLTTNSNLINIDGVLYKSSKSHLVRSTNSSTSGKRSSIGSTKLNTSLSSLKNKKLRRQSSIGKSTKLNVSLKNTTGKILTGQKLNYKHVISNRVKQRSLQILRHKMCKNNQPCLLYQRFGYCAKYIDGICPKVHDKKQVALCKNFLQGKCLLDNCPLSHEVGPEKMPTCKYFLDGCCTRDACQYLHVKVSDNTSICVQFLRGYCAKGNKCKERHTNVCPDFDKTGKCPKGKNCPYPHKSSLLAQQKTFKVHKNINLTSKKNNINTDKNTETIDNSSRDDNLKRYYDESDCNDDNNIEKKRLKLNKTMKLIASIHGESNSIDNLQSLSSIDQTSNDYEKPKRPPIGPLPSYIPIN